MKRRVAAFYLVLVCGLAFAGAACKGKTEDAPVAVDARADRTDLLFVWIDDGGDTHVEVTADAVPKEHRDFVRVIDPTTNGGDKIVLVALDKIGADGRYETKMVSRDDFENVTMKRRAEHGVAVVPSAGAAPKLDTQAAGQAQNRPAVIIYGAEWCGPCHQAAAYLKQRGIPFVEKDIEKDASAQKEMREKLRAAGLSGGSIPVIDVRGRVMQGFSASAVDAALGKGA